MEKCPYHDIEPEYSKKTYRQRLDFPGYKSLPELSLHRYFCPECAKTAGSDSRYKKLSFGFHSFKSKAQAASSWNRGIKSMVLKLFKTAVNGK